MIIPLNQFFGSRYNRCSSQKKISIDFITGGFLVGALAIWGIVSRISLQMQRDDTSNLSQIFRYVCFFLYSCIIVYGTYTEISHLLAAIIVLIMIIEIVVAILIPYRYRIINKLKRKFSK